MLNPVTQVQTVGRDVRAIIETSSWDESESSLFGQKMVRNPWAVRVKFSGAAWQWC